MNLRPFITKSNTFAVVQKVPVENKSVSESRIQKVAAGESWNL